MCTDILSEMKRLSLKWLRTTILTTVRIYNEHLKVCIWWFMKVHGNCTDNRLRAVLFTGRKTAAIDTIRRKIFYRRFIANNTMMTDIPWQCMFHTTKTVLNKSITHKTNTWILCKNKKTLMNNVHEYFIHVCIIIPPSLINCLKVMKMFLLLIMTPQFISGWNKIRNSMHCISVADIVAITVIKNTIYVI